MAEQEKAIEEKIAPPKTETAPAKEGKEKEGGKSQNCTQCKKRLSRKQWYYRDGTYFCSKGCWKTSKASKENEAA